MREEGLIAREVPSRERQVLLRLLATVRSKKRGPELRLARYASAVAAKFAPSSEVTAGELENRQRATVREFAFYRFRYCPATPYALTVRGGVVRRWTNLGPSAKK
jgi:hypothetical protein